MSNKKKHKKSKFDDIIDVSSQQNILDIEGSTDNLKV